MRIINQQGRACRAGFLIMINYIYNQIFYLQECGDFTWRVSDWEELVGVNFRR